MEDLCSRLSKFQNDNQSWNFYDFYDIQNKDLKHSVLNIIKAEYNFIDNLLDKGSYSDVDMLYATIKKTATHMATITFSCLLEQLFLREEMNISFSKEMVSWYRKNGWNFPEFLFEKLDAVTNRLDELENKINKIKNVFNDDNIKKIVNKIDMSFQEQ
jgi:spore coat protein CotF